MARRRTRHVVLGFVRPSQCGLWWSSRWSDTVRLTIKGCGWAKEAHVVTWSSEFGQSPYHVAERYSRGEISRDQVIEALTTWPYETNEVKVEGLHEDLLNYVAGSFDDVEAASLDELIDDEIYTTALKSLSTAKARRDIAPHS